MQLKLQTAIKNIKTKEIIKPTKSPARSGDFTKQLLTTNLLNYSN